MPYTSLDQVDFQRPSLPTLPRPSRVLLTTPSHFDIVYVINPHMEGNLGDVDDDRARTQWQRLVDTYGTLGLDVHTLEGAAGQPDMVFCANQTLPFLGRDGQPGVVLSQMHAPQRRGEVPHYERYFQEQGYTTVALPDAMDARFEGMGDALWHPGRRLLWGGYGFRTQLPVYSFLSERLDAPVLALKLDDPDFYHLDTCLSVLDEDTALIYPGAFDADGLALIHHFFPRIVEAPEDEARGLFACNAHCPDGKHVIIQRGCTETNRRLALAGFEPIEVDTDEYLKSGGSVFCMKLMYW